jgi:hypothetical protein
LRNSFIRAFFTSSLSNKKSQLHHGFQVRFEIRSGEGGHLGGGEVVICCSVVMFIDVTVKRVERESYIEVLRGV